MPAHRTAAAVTLSAFAAVANAGIIGSETIDRTILDSSRGLALIYRGTTQPLVGDGTFADQFSVYTRGGAATRFWSTPFLLEITAPNQYTVVAIGTSRNLGGEAGVRTFDFAAIAGNAVTQVGKSYTFGYYNAQYIATDQGGVEDVSGTANSGAIPLSGYALTTDLWSYALNTDLAIGAIYGTGGFALDSQGFAGRIYSANLSFGVPAPAAAATLALAGLTAARRRR